MPLIQAAKRLGHWVLVTHPQSEGAEGFAYADATEIVDPRDLTKVLDIAKKHKIDAAVSDACDYSMYAVAFLGEHLGFPAIRLDQAQFVTNKLNMRARISATGAPVLQPEYRACLTFDQAAAAADTIGYPVMVKPVDNRGNIGSTRADNPEDLKESWHLALANAHSRVVLVEKFIEGTLCTIEGFFVRRGVYKPLAASWKKMYGGKKRSSIENTYDTEHIKDALSELLRTDNEVVKALGLDFGATHGEYMITPENKVYLVEIHNRGGGVHINSKICPAVSGVDTNECLVRLATEGKTQIDPTKNYFMSKGSAILSFFTFDHGKVKDWAGTELIERDPRVIDFRMLIKKGAELQHWQNDCSRPAQIIVKGKNEDDCQKALQELKPLVKIIYGEPLDQQSIEGINKQTLERYNKRLAEQGPGAYALGWGTEDYQRKRFHDLLHALKPEDINGKTVLDIGCGLADLYSFLKEQGFELKNYVGTDINSQFLAIAQQRYPDCTFEPRDLMLDPYAEPVADIGIMLGVMNFKLADNKQYAREMIKKAFAAVRETLVVNVISDVHNDEYPREPTIHYYKPNELLAFAQTLTPFCSLIHDYKGQPQHECMLVMRKQPWRTDGNH